VGADVVIPSTPSAAGVDARGLAAFLDALDADPAIRPHGLVVLRDGRRIAHGSWAPYSADRVQLLYSVSKSFTSTAAGLARQEGLLDLDATVVSYFPEIDGDITDPRSRAMTVRHVAAMASGHAGETLDLARALDPRDLVRGFLLVPPESDPGTVFAYNQPCTYALAAIVQRVTGMSLVEYLTPRLFDPLGIDDVTWLEYPAGRDIGFSGLHATTDAMARLGELYRRGGLWGERRLLDAAWVEEATTWQIATPQGEPDWSYGYGFQFWLGRHGYRADGAYGQVCVVVPEAGLVVALTSETEATQRILDALWTHVLPAIDGPTDPDHDAVLATRLAGLSLAPPNGLAEPSVPADWPERTFPVEPAAQASTSVTSVRVARRADDAGWRIHLSDGGGSVETPFGVTWMSGEGPAPVVAAAGGWSDEDELAVELLFLDTPHTLRVTCSPRTGLATARWLTEPLHGTVPSTQHRNRGSAA